MLIDEHVTLHDADSEEIRPIGRPDPSVTRGPRAEPSRIASAGVLEAPARVVVPEQDEERESFLTIRDRVSRQVIAVIEMLSPANKLPGANRRRYLAKRAELLNSPAHLVEIDLLRGGQPMPARGRPDCVYSVHVSRAGERPDAGF